MNIVVVIFVKAIIINNNSALEEEVVILVLEIFTYFIFLWEAYVFLGNLKSEIKL